MASTLPAARGLSRQLLLLKPAQAAGRQAMLPPPPRHAPAPAHTAAARHVAAAASAGAAVPGDGQPQAQQPGSSSAGLDAPPTPAGFASLERLIASQMGGGPGGDWREVEGW